MRTYFVSINTGLFWSCKSRYEKARIKVSLIANLPWLRIAETGSVKQYHGEVCNVKLCHPRPKFGRVRAGLAAKMV
jgi:hypothetical protein